MPLGTHTHTVALYLNSAKTETIWLALDEIAVKQNRGHQVDKLSLENPEFVSKFSIAQTHTLTDTHTHMHNSGFKFHISAIVGNSGQNIKLTRSLVLKPPTSKLLVCLYITHQTYCLPAGIAI